METQIVLVDKVRTPPHIKVPLTFEQWFDLAYPQEEIAHDLGAKAFDMYKTIKNVAQSAWDAASINCQPFAG